MPLPIEKSQGSVNNLIKRFQQASDLASRQKERQERTRPPGRSVSGSSASFEKNGAGWRRASGASESGSIDLDLGKPEQRKVEGKEEDQGDKIEVLVDEPEEVKAASGETDSAERVKREPAEVEEGEPEIKDEPVLDAESTVNIPIDQPAEAVEIGTGLVPPEPAPSQSLPEARNDPELSGTAIPMDDVQERQDASDETPVEPEIETPQVDEAPAAIEPDENQEKKGAEEQGPLDAAESAAGVRSGSQERDDPPIVQDITKDEDVRPEETDLAVAVPDAVELVKTTPDVNQAVSETAVLPEIKADRDTKVETTTSSPAPSASESPAKKTSARTKTTTPRQTRAATTPSKTSSSTAQTPLRAQRTGGLPVSKPITPSGRTTKSSAPPTSSTRSSPQTQSKPATPSGIPRTARKSLTPSGQTVTPLRPSQTGSTTSPSPAQTQPLRPHHTGAVTPLRPQTTGTRAIERSPLYAPTASSLAKTKQKVAASPSPAGEKNGTGRKESVGSASEVGPGQAGSRSRVVSASGSGSSARSR